MYHITELQNCYDFCNKWVLSAYGEGVERIALEEILIEEKDLEEWNNESKWIFKKYRFLKNWEFWDLLSAILTLASETWDIRSMKPRHDKG